MNKRYVICGILVFAILLVLVGIFGTDQSQGSMLIDHLKP